MDILLVAYCVSLHSEPECAPLVLALRLNRDGPPVHVDQIFAYKQA
jgi:hypothetical protein